MVQAQSPKSSTDTQVSTETEKNYRLENRIYGNEELRRAVNKTVFDVINPPASRQMELPLLSAQIEIPGDLIEEAREKIEELLVQRGLAREITVDKRVDSLVVEEKYDEDQYWTTSADWRHYHAEKPPRRNRMAVRRNKRR